MKLANGSRVPIPIVRLFASLVVIVVKTGWMDFQSNQA